ncbi:MAG: hypothetical protein AAGB14_02335 [Verrucomicrobiota bacterium]
MTGRGDFPVTHLDTAPSLTPTLLICNGSNMIAKWLLLGLLVTGMASAQKVPRGTFNASQYEEAKAKAAESGKKIAVIATEIDSSCPKCVYGNETAFKKMRSDYVFVLEDSGNKEETGTLPPAIKQKTYTIYKEKGNTIPIITIFSPESDAVLGGACYKQIAGDERKWLKDLEAEIETKEAELADSSGGKPEETKEDSETAETACDTEGLREWTDVRGRTMKAELLEADEIKASFKLENGKVVDIPLARLSKESQAIIAECQE